MGDPQVYITPDVITDFTTIRLEQEGPERVKISGVQGRKPTDLLKVSVSLTEGYKASGSLIISGPDARTKAEVFARVLWDRLGTELETLELEPIESTHTEFIGDDATHRGLTPEHRPAEILLRLGARDRDRKKLSIFRKLLPSLILSGPSGVAVTGGAPAISEVIRYWPTLIPQEVALSSVSILVQEKGGDGPQRFAERLNLTWPVTGGQAGVVEEATDPYPSSLLSAFEGAPKVEVALIRVAHARSGDKGDTASIGLIGRSPECYVWLRQNVSAERVKEWFKDIVRGNVERYPVPRLWAINFLLNESLGGGGTVSLHIDAQGKTYGPALLRCKVEVPEPLLDTIAPENAACPGELV